jgi:hypothetical protein
MQPHNARRCHGPSSNVALLDHNNHINHIIASGGHSLLRRDEGEQSTFHAMQKPMTVEAQRPHGA